MAWIGPCTSTTEDGSVTPQVAGKTSETAMSTGLGVGESSVQLVVVVPSGPRKRTEIPLSVEAIPLKRSFTPRHESGF
jgi:hypothetical protein